MASNAPDPLVSQSIALDFLGHPAFDETAQANRQALAAALEALSAGDASPFWALFDPQVTFHEASCLPYGGAHRGLEAVQEAFSALAANFSKIDSRFEALLASRDIVILYQHIAFEAAATGKSGAIPVAELFRFRNGRIIEWRAHYFDACLVAEALKG
ncbi:MAG: nuclear transport factor 2 family protein [Novosphingobium sp.]|nr:nuclear transport factor 2 family protein [Novosphingobium sp.]